MFDLLEVSAAIKQRRKELGLSQQELAIKAGVARNRVAGLETGRLPDVGLKTLTKILHALGLDLRVTALNLRRPTLEDLRAERGTGPT